MKTNRFLHLTRAQPIVLGAAAFSAVIAFVVSPEHADVTLGIFAALSLTIALAIDYAPARPVSSAFFRAEIPARVPVRHRSATVTRRVVPALTERR